MGKQNGLAILIDKMVEHYEVLLLAAGEKNTPLATATHKSLLHHIAHLGALQFVHSCREDMTKVTAILENSKKAKK